MYDYTKEHASKQEVSVTWRFKPNLFPGSYTSMADHHTLQPCSQASSREKSYVSFATLRTNAYGLKNQIFDEHVRSAWVPISSRSRGCSRGYPYLAVRAAVRVIKFSDRSYFLACRPHKTPPDHPCVTVPYHPKVKMAWHAATSHESLQTMWALAPIQRSGTSIIFPLTGESTFCPRVALPLGLLCMWPPYLRCVWGNTIA
jgi:hypothetical protein